MSDQAQNNDDVASSSPFEANAQVNQSHNASGQANAAIAALEQQLQVAEDKAQDHWQKLLRLKADMENQQKRTQVELENSRKFANEKLIKELLNVVDSFERGIASSTTENVTLETLLQGQQLTLNMLLDVLRRNSVEALDPTGQAFNPEHHQAMSMQPRSDCPPNQVLSVMQKGYMLQGRLIRPALVVVSKAE